MIEAAITVQSADGYIELSLAIDASSLALPSPDFEINLDIFQISLARHELAVGMHAYATLRDGQVHIQARPPSRLSPGIYEVANLRILHTTGHPRSAPLAGSGRIAPIYFELIGDIANGEQQSISQRVRAILDERERYLKSEFCTSAAKGRQHATRFCCIVFGVGCLISSAQHFKGVSLVPLKEGLSYEGMLAAVNSFMDAGFDFSLKRNAHIERDFKLSTPCVALIFHKVAATSPSDAIAFCAGEAELIFSILGLDRGHKPSEFASLCFDANRECVYRFRFPTYPGNWASPFDPNETAHRIEKFLPKLDKSPWLRLLVDTYASATTERVAGFRYFRHWAVLELIASSAFSKIDKPLLDSSGSPILSDDGKPMRTEMGAAAKVYQYLFELDASRRAAIFNESNWSLWQVVGAWYEVRNQVAHTGEFVPSPSARPNTRKAIATQYFDGSIDPLLDSLQTIARVSVLHEIDRPEGPLSGT